MVLAIFIKQDHHFDGLFLRPKQEVDFDDPV